MAHHFHIAEFAGNTARVVKAVELFAEVLTSGVFHERRVAGISHGNQVFAFTTFLLGSELIGFDGTFRKAVEVVLGNPHFALVGGFEGILAEFKSEFREFSRQFLVLCAVVAHKVGARASKAVVSFLQKHHVLGVEVILFAVIVNIFHFLPELFVKRYVG